MSSSAPPTASRVAVDELGLPARERRRPRRPRRPALAAAAGSAARGVGVVAVGRRRAGAGRAPVSRSIRRLRRIAVAAATAADRRCGR